MLGMAAPILASLLLVSTVNGFTTPHLNAPLSIPLAAASTDHMVKSMGEEALSKVQWLGSIVSRNADQPMFDENEYEENIDKEKVDGTGGTVYSRLATNVDGDRKKDRQVWIALANLEKDSK
jgi:hypothetical protein